MNISDPVISSVGEVTPACLQNVPCPVSYLAHLSHHLSCDIYLCIYARLSAAGYVCARTHVILFFFWGTPAGRPNEAQLQFAVQKVAVVLQRTHELLKAMCGRWHSPLFPQPRRHRQMVGVKTLNIKQPSLFYFFIFFCPGPPSLTSFRAFRVFCSLHRG